MPTGRSSRPQFNSCGISKTTARADAASQLAQEGYTIDVPIMVWGWDPATTIAAREAMNYTWVPSALHQP